MGTITHISTKLMYISVWSVFSIIARRHADRRTHTRTDENNNLLLRYAGVQGKKAEVNQLSIRLLIIFRTLCSTVNIVRSAI